jgi:hypothetical protein
MSSNQDVYNSRDMRRSARCGYGTFRHSRYEHAAEAAAIMSQQVGHSCACNSCAGTSTAGTITARPHLADVRAAIYFHPGSDGREDEFLKHLA